MARAYMYYLLGGLIVFACGAYLVGSWWITWGVFLMLWANNIVRDAERKYPPRPRVNKDWIGNQRGVEP